VLSPFPDSPVFQILQLRPYSTYMSLGKKGEFLALGGGTQKPHLEQGVVRLEVLG
jgi:hypothetical protein